MNYQFLYGAYPLCCAEISMAWFNASIPALLKDGADAWAVMLKGA